MNKKISTLAIICVIALSGCSTMNSKEFGSPMNLETRAVHEPIIEVGEKITGESSFTNILWIFDVGADSEFADGVVFGNSVAEKGSMLGFIPLADSTSGVKNAAIYNALQKSGADVIIAPRYKLKTVNYVLFKTYTATVEGYRGTIKGFKQINLSGSK
tara:strand:- start:79 stop:552 length:474 start_codon:yes stop_codon:yes gene_type:complete